MEIAVAIALAAAAVLPDWLSWILDKLLAPAIVAVAFAGATTAVLEQYRGRRDAVSKMTDAFREDLKAAQDAAIEYWSRARKDDDETVEAGLVAMQQDLMQSYRLVYRALELEPDAVRLETLHTVIDALTGGTFKDANRPADHERVQRLLQAATKLRGQIVEARLQKLQVLGGIFSRRKKR